MDFQNNKPHQSQGNIDHTVSDHEISERIIAGLDRFLSRIFEGHPVSLADFLDSSEEYFDNYIIDTSRKEHLDFVGGKLIFTPKAASAGRAASPLFSFRQGTNSRSTSSIQIEIMANLYFQDAQKKWVMKTLQGHTTSDSIRDWNTAPELKDLRRGQPIEFPIDPPAVNR